MPPEQSSRLENRRSLLNSFREDIERPLAEGPCCRPVRWDSVDFVAHIAEHTLSSYWNGQQTTPDLQPQSTTNNRLWCPTCARAVHDPLVSAIAPQSSAAFCGLRSNRLTNSPSAIHGETQKSTRSTRVEKSPGPAASPLASGRWLLAAWRQPWVSRRSAYTSPFACSSGRANGSLYSNRHAA